MQNISCINNGLGKSGGLTLLWRKDVNHYSLDSNKNLIECYILASNSSNYNNMI